MGRLDGKVAIVTGSGRGLGRAYALAMASEGCSIVLNSVDTLKRSAEKTAMDIKNAGGKAIPVIGSVGSRETADKLVNTAIKEFGCLQILVNNAGQSRDSLLIPMTEEQWDGVIYVHLRGTFMNTQAAVKYMVENKIRGKIINITSGVGIYGNIGQSNYSAAKGGIIALTKTLSKELARYGICVNAVAPMAKTELFGNVREDLRNFMFQAIAKKNVLQRVGMPEDVAPIIVFLASDSADFLSGQIICASGDVGELPWD